MATSMPTPMYVRMLGVAALALIVFAVFTPGRDWGAGLDSRITKNAFGGFFENDEGQRFNTNYRIEHTADVELGLESSLIEPVEAMLFRVEPDGDAESLPRGAPAVSRKLMPGRYTWPVRVGVAERREEAFVAVAYSAVPFDWSAIERLLADVERPITLHSLHHSNFVGEVFSLHLRALDEDGQAR